MIPALRFSEILESIKTDVNAAIDDSKLKIAHVIIAVTEAQLPKKLSDKKGILLVAYLPPANSDIQTADNYSEDNHCLLFVVEKREPSKYNDEKELTHFDAMQKIMREVKKWILAHGLNGDTDEPETLSKPFRTEWEHQIYGNYNGLSISFDLKDFEL